MMVLLLMISLIECYQRMVQTYGNILNFIGRLPQKRPSPKEVFPDAIVP